MKFVFTSYISTPTYKHPETWLKRIRAYTGILEALAVKNEVISIEQIDYEGDYFKDGVNYEFMHFTKYFPVMLHLFIKKHKPDVVFIQSLHFPLQVMLLRFMLGGKTKIMIQNHAEKPFAGIKKRLSLIADRYINAYLFASKIMGLGWISQGSLASPAKIYEVMELSSVFYPIDKTQAINQTGAAGRSIFLWVGRLDKNKDPLTVTGAFLKYAAINPGARLYMIYHTNELLSEIKEQLNNDANGNSITLIGKVPNDELLYWYNSADFIVSGSHYEGSGTAVCEALSCGCVPVITDIPSFRMMTSNGNIGILYEPGNEAQLLSALIKTQQMDMHEERVKALAYFKANLSFEAIAKQIQDIAASC